MTDQKAWESGSPVVSRTEKGTTSLIAWPQAGYDEQVKQSKTQRAILEELKSINNKIGFFVALAVIALVIQVIAWLMF